LLCLGSIYKTASYHNVMAATYSNAARHWYVREEPTALFGTLFVSHLGMGFHYGQGWALFFNLLAAMHDACTDPVRNAADDEQGTEIAGGGGGVGGNETRAYAPTRRHGRWPLEELPTKYKGRYHPSVGRIQRQWRQNVAAKGMRCQNVTADDSIVGDLAAAAGAKSWPPYQTSVCEYAWVAIKATPFADHRNVRSAMDRVLTRNEGWAITGEPIEGEPGTFARTAWLANRTQARFDIEVKDLRRQQTSLTVVSMKSYGPDWVASKLRVTVEVIRPASSSGTTASSAGVVSGPFEIDGYHDLPTSVYFPHKFALAGSGASNGDTVRATFELVSGHAFKIAGLALCRLDDE
jgi:hypothetical protein